MPSKIRWWLILLGLVAVLVMLAFGVCLKHDFNNWDDDRLISGNPVIRELSVSHIKAMFSYSFCGTYLPLTLFSFALEYQLFGLNPLPYHLTNLMLHALNSLLAGMLVWLLSRQRPTAVITALLFAVHPLRVESVAWLTERKDVLFAAFYLLSLTTYLAYRRRSSKTAYALSLGFFALSGLAKGTALTLPLVLILIDLFYHRSERYRLGLEKIPFIVLGVFFGLTALISQRSLISYPLPLLPKLLLIAWVPVFYLFKTILPIGLSPLYPYPRRFPEHIPWSFLIAPVVMIAIAGLLLWLYRKNREMVFGPIFFAITLLPVGQIITIAGPEIAANRYTYLPLLGIFFLLAQTITVITRRGRIKTVLAYGAGFIIIGFLTLITQHRCLIWRDSITLWNDVLTRYPDVGEAYNQRGLALMAQENLSGALSDFSRAVELNPGLASAYNNRGLAYRRLGKLKPALDNFNHGLLISPRDPDLYYNRGNLYLEQEAYEAAIKDYTTVLELNPQYLPALNNRGNAYCRSRAYEAGIADYNRLLRIDPEYLEARYNRAVAYFLIGDVERSRQDIRQLQQAGYRINPSFLDELNQH